MLYVVFILRLSPPLEVSFHKAAEAALHRLGQHRVLYLHSEEAERLPSSMLFRALGPLWATLSTPIRCGLQVTAQLSNDERAFLQLLEETITARIRPGQAGGRGMPRPASRQSALALTLQGRRFRAS